MEHTRLILLCERDSFETFHQAASAAAAELAQGGRADLVLFHGALARWLRGDVNRVTGPSWMEPYRASLETGRVRAPGQVLAEVRRDGAGLFACSASVALLGHEPVDLLDRVDEVVGWPTILRWIRESDAALHL